MHSKNLVFISIIPTDEHIATLFDLLKSRLHKISYGETDFREHEKFVKEHPYRCWYLIKIKDTYMGSFYVTKENTIGINIMDECTHFAVSEIIRFVQDNYEPLPSIKSVREERFAINVPPTNKNLNKSLEEIGATIAQITYFIPN